jgi:hypothetical protein
VKGKDLARRDEGATPTRARMLQKITELARQEATVALPAAKRAATHGLQAFWKKFSEEYAKERRKR